MEWGGLFKEEEGMVGVVGAKRLRMNTESLSGGYCRPYEGWEDSLLPPPEPCHDPFLLLSQRQYRQVQGHARVVLSGYGGDDILTGQAWPYLTYLFHRRRFRPILKTFGLYIHNNVHIPPFHAVFLTPLRR